VRKSLYTVDWVQQIQPRSAAALEFRRANLRWREAEGLYRYLRREARDCLLIRVYRQDTWRRVRSYASPVFLAGVRACEAADRGIAPARSFSAAPWDSGRN
jgi:hypothetical protein